MGKIIQITANSEYNSIVMTIIVILIIGRMIDKFVNGNNNKNE